MFSGLSLRVRLALLVMGTMLPLIVFIGGLVYLQYERDRANAFGRVIETARGIRLVLDSEMQGVTAGLQVLAQSEALRRSDFEGFRGAAEAFLTQYPGSSSIWLADRDGTQVLNTRVAPGEPLPPRSNLDAIEEVFRSRRPAYSGLHRTEVASRPIVTVTVPVFREGTVAYAIVFNPPLETFQSIIYQQRPGRQWTVAIFDENGVTLAHVPNPDEAVGRSAASTMPAVRTAEREASQITTSPEGLELITAFTRSPYTGWTVAAGVPTATVTGPLWRALAITAVTGIILLAIGLGFAIGMAARIARGEMLHALLIDELNHRVKNTLAIVQSIAAQTFRREGDMTEAKRKFDARLAALGHAHQLLSDEKWHSAELREIIGGVVSPYTAQDAGRIQLSGGDVRVTPRAALMLAMVVHELATNAAKYGALSVAGGKVFIDWQTTQNPKGRDLQLSWKEVGGPPVEPSDRKGFGSSLIEQGVESQLGGSAKVEMAESGLRCTVTVPA